MKNKIYVIGIDGATWKILTPLLKNDSLPFIKSLIKKSAYGTLLSPIPALSAPSWVSFQTGVNPGKHGIYDFVKYQNKSISLNDSFDLKAPTVWEILSKYDKSSLVINMPLTYPPKIENGVLVSCFLTPLGKNFVSPLKYQKKLEKIGYKIDLLTDGKYGELPNRKLSNKERIVYLEQLIEISKKRLEAFKLLSELNNFDFNYLLFKESDLAQHLFWGCKELTIYFKNLDMIIKDLYEYLNKINKDGFGFFIISDHGFHASPKYEFSIYRWLTENTSLNNQSSSWNLITELNKKVKKTGLILTKYKKINEIKGKYLTKSKVDFVDTHGFVITPHGLYDYGGLEKIIRKKDFIRMLKTIKYKNISVFKYISSSNEIYKGEYVKYAPSVIWILNDEFIMDTNVYSNKIFKRHFNILKGEHSSDREGIYILNDKYVKKGKSSDQEIYDITKLILTRLLSEPPWYFDGKIPDCVYEPIDKKYKKYIDDKLTNEIKYLNKI